MRQYLPILPFLLSGCMSHGVRPLRPHDLATAPYQEVITAALTGTLMYEGGCLEFRDEASPIRLLPVWPIGSEFNGTSVIFHEPGKTDQRIMVGEEFLIEGQPFGWQALPDTSYAPFHVQCPAQPFYVSAVRPAN